MFACSCCSICFFSARVSCLVGGISPAEAPTGGLPPATRMTGLPPATRMTRGWEVLGDTQEAVALDPTTTEVTPAAARTSATGAAAAGTFLDHPPFTHPLKLHYLGHTIR